MKTKIHFHHISLISSWNEKCFRQTLQRKSKHTFCAQKLFFNCAFYEIMWKNIVERGRPQMEIWRMRIACWVPEAKTHTNKLCNTHCFPTATVVARTRLSVTLYSYLHYLSCINRV